MEEQQPTPNLDEEVYALALENPDASLENPLRGGTTYLLRKLRPRRGETDAFEPHAWAFLDEQQGAIVHESAPGTFTVEYYNAAELEEAWERAEQAHEEDVEAAQ